VSTRADWLGLVREVAKHMNECVANGNPENPITRQIRLWADSLDIAADRLASLPVEGWVWVPRNPTREMMAAGAEIVGHILPEDDGETDPHYVSIGAAIGVYGAMIAAAPQDQRQGNEQGGTHE